MNTESVTVSFYDFEKVKELKDGSPLMYWDGSANFPRVGEVVVVRGGIYTVTQLTWHVDCLPWKVDVMMKHVEDLGSRNSLERTEV